MGLGIKGRWALVCAASKGLGLSNGARNGLTGFIGGIARQPSLAGANVMINNLLPGYFNTARSRDHAQAAAMREGQTLETMLQKRRAAVPAGRLGEPEEFGTFCAFLCSAHVSYVTGQKFLLDGGAYAGTF
jgi:3-oxoacyl-[acyl-carrier protein] reductase